MKHLGDYDANTNIHDKFGSVANANSVGTLLANGNLIVFKDNSTANSIAGVTLTANFAGIAGLNHWNCNTAANGTFFSAGSFFQVVLANGTVGGTSVAGYPVASFTIRVDSALKPTTANRTLTVDAGGTAQANVTAWLGVTVVAFGAANGPVINGVNSGNITANITGNLTGTVGNMNGTASVNVIQWLGVAPQQLGAANGIVINGLNAGNITANVTGNMTGSVGSMNGNVGGNILGNMNGNVGGNVVGTVASVIGSVGSVTGGVGGDLGGNVNGNVGGNVNGSVGNILVGGSQFIADTLLDRTNAIEIGITPRLALRYAASSVAGNLSGGNTTVVVITGVGVATPRITAAVEANGNTRTVTLS